MLGLTGKLAAMVTIAGGALLMQTDRAAAAEQCTLEDEEFMQCVTPAGQECMRDGNDRYCTMNYGCFVTYNHQGRIVTWMHDCVNNGPHDCMIIQPCG